MARKRKAGPQLYGTKQVAQILDIPEWRVKNFSEGAAYGLPPSQRVGSGRGSRRLYGATDICRLAIANELVNCGFTPEEVGRAMREIPESVLLEPVFPEAADEEEDLSTELEYPMLVYMHNRWRVRQESAFAEALRKHFGFDGEGTGIFILNIWSLLSEVGKKIRVPLHQSEQQ